MEDHSSVRGQVCRALGSGSSPRHGGAPWDPGLRHVQASGLPAACLALACWGCSGSSGLFDTCLMLSPSSSLADGFFSLPRRGRPLRSSAPRSTFSLAYPPLIFCASVGEVALLFVEPWRRVMWYIVSWSWRWAGPAQVLGGVWTQDCLAPIWIPLLTEDLDQVTQACFLMYRRVTIIIPTS